MKPSEQGLPGHSMPRVDGYDKVTGRSLYVDDLNRDGQWHGWTVRSDVARGKLTAIERDPNFDWSDVVVVTAQDISGPNFVALIEPDQPVLVPVDGMVRHADEPIALVAAPTVAKAKAAAKALKFEIHPEPGVFSIEESLEGKVKLYGDDNVFKRFEINKGGDIEAALASADIVIEGTYRTGAQEQMYIEPNGILAWWEEDNLHVCGSMQCPYYIHKAMVSLFELKPEQAIITQAVTGGGFGGKEEYPSMLSAHAALLSKKARRPVKLIYDRSEDVGATTKRHPSRVRHRLGVNKGGTLVAMDIDVVIDGGAYATLSSVVLSRAILHAPGPYRCENVRVVGRAVATNAPPHGAYRGFGAPQTTFPYERQIDKAAQALGMDPLAFRAANALREGDVTATGQTLQYSVGSDAVLQAAKAFRKVPALHQADSKKRGQGMAFYFHGAGFTGSGEDRLKGTVTIAATGKNFEIRSSSTDIGQGTFTTFVQLCSHALGVDTSEVVMRQPETNAVPDSGPTVASRTCMVVGAVVEQAALRVRERLKQYGERKGMPHASLHELGAAWVLEHGHELCESASYKSPAGIRWDDATYSGDAYPVYGWAACVVDVAVDPDTYEVTVERCFHAVDVGKAIHPVIVKGQIEGGTLQALGWALWENVVYQDGRVANRRMTDCIIPTSMEAPEMTTEIVEVPYPHGPQGAKGVGEIPMDGPAAAVANALVDALGTEFDTIPMLPEVILANKGRAA